MLFLATKHEKKNVKGSPNWEEKRIEIALRPLTTSIPACAAQLRCERLRTLITRARSVRPLCLFELGENEVQMVS
ncbi:hypothetical protein Y032_0133g1755 [Ancylostoma ceylanicum]|uniref:Uncharacterized protein n=1 Tax=Ancylostoma ceylanicum TaxID=53326 RepID=A0A016T6F9_9BILA|nr:hypothetical protein Y032_0133g1755 [Ancylostoma ceylanicum]